MTAESFINLIDSIGNTTTRIIQAVIANLGAIIFWIGILALLAMFIYAIWDVKRNKSTVGDVLSDHGGKIIVIVLIIIAGGIIQNMKPAPTGYDNQKPIIIQYS